MNVNSVNTTIPNNSIAQQNNQTIQPKKRILKYSIAGGLGAIAGALIPVEKIVEKKEGSDVLNNKGNTLNLLKTKEEVSKLNLPKIFRNSFLMLLLAIGLTKAYDYFKPEK